MQSLRRWVSALFATCLLGLPAFGQNVTLTGTIQGASGLPASNYTLALQPSQYFFVANTAIIVNETVDCATSIDGTVVGTSNPLSPMISNVNYATGTLTPGIYFLQYAWYDAASNQTLASVEQQQQLTSTGSLLLSPPPTGMPASAVGMRVYIGTTSGGEKLQGSTIGNASYSQLAPLTGTVAVPTINTTLCHVVANDAGWPTGTGYNVTLSDASGNTSPGYPMEWRLLGPNTTINLANGLPEYNGLVTYPVPLLSQPYNHNEQSISGPLDFGQYGLFNVGQETVTQLQAGQITASVLNGVYVANACGNSGPPSWCAGADMGAWINSAVTICPTLGCKVGLLSGNFTVTTPIVLSKQLILECLGPKGSCVLTQSFQGDLIAVSPGADNGEIDKLWLNVNVSVGTNAIIVRQANRWHIHDNIIMDTRPPASNAQLGIRVWGQSANGTTYAPANNTIVDHNWVQASWIAYSIADGANYTDFHDNYAQSSNECFDFNGINVVTIGTKFHDNTCQDANGSFFESVQESLVEHNFWRVTQNIGSGYMIYSHTVANVNQNNFIRNNTFDGGNIESSAIYSFQNDINLHVEGNTLLNFNRSGIFVQAAGANVSSGYFLNNTIINAGALNMAGDNCGIRFDTGPGTVANMHILGGEINNTPVAICQTGSTAISGLEIFGTSLYSSATATSFAQAPSGYTACYTAGYGSMYCPSMFMAALTNIPLPTGTIANGSCDGLVAVVPGAAVGMIAHAGPVGAAALTGLNWGQTSVTTAGQVSVPVCNYSGSTVTVTTPMSEYFRAVVFTTP